MFLDRVSDTTTVNCDPMRCENRTQKQQRPFQHGNVESTASESPNTEVDASESTSVLGAEMERTAQHRGVLAGGGKHGGPARGQYCGIVTKTPPFSAENRLCEVLERVRSNWLADDTVGGIGVKSWPEDADDKMDE